MKSLIIIPAYNEMNSIENTIKDIQEHTTSFDYVIINDCSEDGTKEVCEKNGFNVIHLPLNLGIGGAVQTGYKYAKEMDYDIAVQFDGDGQHKAEYLEDMKEYLIREKADMVIGSRFLKGEGFQSTYLRRKGITYFSFLIERCTGIKITDPTSGMRMVNKRMISLFSESYPKDYPEPESLTQVLKRKFSVIEFSVEMKERQFGESSITILESLYYMIKVSLAVLLAVSRKK